MCRIEEALGRSQLCSETHCPFWEEGAFARPGGCAFDPLDLQTRQRLAGWLVRLRGELEAEAAGDRHAFFDRLNAGRGD